MPLDHPQHVLIQTADLEGMEDWRVGVLGLEVRLHPDFRTPLYWRDLNGRDVLHITTGGMGSAPTASAAPTRSPRRPGAGGWSIMLHSTPAASPADSARSPTTTSVNCS